MTKTMKGVVLASAVASLFAGAALAGDKGTMKKEGKQASAEGVRCEGINECKGKGECGGAKHDCAGMNECKGKGWVSVAAKDCKAKGGKVLAAAKK